MDEHPEFYLRYLPVQLGVVCVLLLLGGCFAGLTLGLMSLDPTSLKILAKVRLVIHGGGRVYVLRCWPAASVGVNVVGRGRCVH